MFDVNVVFWLLQLKPLMSCDHMTSKYNDVHYALAAKHLCSLHVTEFHKVLYRDQGRDFYIG